MCRSASSRVSHQGGHEQISSVCGRYQPGDWYLAGTARGQAVRGGRRGRRVNDHRVARACLFGRVETRRACGLPRTCLDVVDRVSSRRGDRLPRLHPLDPRHRAGRGGPGDGPQRVGQDRGGRIRRLRGHPWVGWVRGRLLGSPPGGRRAPGRPGARARARVPRVRDAQHRRSRRLDRALHPRRRARRRFRHPAVSARHPGLRLRALGDISQTR